MHIIPNKVMCNYCWLEGNDFKNAISALEVELLSAKKNYDKHVFDFSLISFNLEHSYMQHKDCNMKFFFFSILGFIQTPRVIVRKIIVLGYNNFFF